MSSAASLYHRKLTTTSSQMAPREGTKSKGKGKGKEAVSTTVTSPPPMPSPRLWNPEEDRDDEQGEATRKAMRVEDHPLWDGEFDPAFPVSLDQKTNLPPRFVLLSDIWKYRVAQTIPGPARVKLWPASFDAKGRPATTDLGYGTAATKEENAVAHYIVGFANIELHGDEGREQGLPRIWGPKATGTSVKHIALGHPVNTQAPEEKATQASPTAVSFPYSTAGVSVAVHGEGANDSPAEDAPSNAERSVGMTTSNSEAAAATVGEAFVPYEDPFADADVDHIPTKRPPFPSIQNPQPTKRQRQNSSSLTNPSDSTDATQIAELRKQLDAVQADLNATKKQAAEDRKRADEERAADRRRLRKAEEMVRWLGRLNQSLSTEYITLSEALKVIFEYEEKGPDQEDLSTVQLRHIRRLSLVLMTEEFKDFADKYGSKLNPFTPKIRHEYWPARFDHRGRPHVWHVGFGQAALCVKDGKNHYRVAFSDI